MGVVVDGDEAVCVDVRGEVGGEEGRGGRCGGPGGRGKNVEVVEACASGGFGSAGERVHGFDKLWGVMLVYIVLVDECSFSLDCRH